MSAVAIAYKLLLVPPTTIFAARVNQETFSNDAAQVAFDGVTTGAYTDIMPEMMILFGTTAGADDLGRARVRKAATSSVLYFGWASRALGEGEVYLIDDAYITVLDLYKPWTKNPRITPAGVSYTDYDRSFGTYGDLPPVILLECGPATQQPLDSETNKATFSFDASNSYVTDAHASAISTWAWTLPGGASLTGGATDSDTVTFTLPESAAWCSVVATDDNGTSATRRILCIAGEPSGTLSQFDQIELIRRPEGQTLRARISESIPESTYPNGCMVVMWKRQTADGVATTPSGLTGHEHVCFVGWHYQDDTEGRADENGFLDDTVIDCRDVGGWLQVLPGYPIIIERRNTPGTWTEMYHLHMDRYYMRLLAEYCNVLLFTDFSWSGLGETYYPIPALRSEGTTLYEQIDTRAQAIAHKLTCDQWGRLAIKPDPQLLDDEGGTATPITRTATVQKAVTEAVWSDIQLSALPFPRVNWSRENAIVAEALNVSQIARIKTVFCTAPGNAPGQGVSSSTSGEQLVTDQDEINARAGHRYAARHNNPLPSIEVTLATPDDFAIQPAYMEWITFTNSATSTGQRGRTYSATRFLPIEVTINHEAELGSQTVVIRAEKEVVGYPAKTYIPPKDDSNPPEPDLPPEDWEPIDIDILNLREGLQKIFLIHENGEVSITSDYQTPSTAGGPSYTVVDLSLDGTALDAAGDPYSPRFLGTGGGVNCWIITTTKIYYVEDICDADSSRTVNLQHTFASETAYRTFGGERGIQNWMIVSSYYESGGTKACYTTDGSSWTEVTVTANTLGATNVTQDWTGIDWSHFWDITQELPAWMEYGVAQGNFWVVGEGLMAYPNDISGLYQLELGLPLDYGGGTATHIYMLIQVVSNFDYATQSRIATNQSTLITIGDPGWDDTDPSGGGQITVEKTTVSEPLSIPSDGKIRYHLEGHNPGGTWDDTYANAGHILAVAIGGTGTDPFDDPGTPAFMPTPTIHVSGKVAGLAYIGAINGGVGDLYASTDYGATWALSSLLGHDYDLSLGGTFMFPWHNNNSDLRYYWGSFDGLGYSAYTSLGVDNVDITPSSGFGPADPKCWGSCAQNWLIMSLQAYNGTSVIGFRSVNGGASWSTILPITTRANAYTGVAIGDDPDVMWFWGPAGTAYSDTGGTIIDDRKGDCSTSEVILLGGW